MIPLPYKLAIVGVALIGTFFLGREHGLQRYYDYRASVETQMEQIKRENAARVASMEQAHQQAVQTWDAARASLAGRTVVRVRDNCGEGKMPALPTAPTRVEGLQASGGEGWITTAQCERIANDSTLDREWIETVKKLTDDWHEASK